MRNDTCKQDISGLKTFPVCSVAAVVFVCIQYNTIQYNTIQYNTIQYNTIQYNTIQYNTIQYNTIQYIETLFITGRAIKNFVQTGIVYNMCKHVIYLIYITHTYIKYINFALLKD